MINTYFKKVCYADEAFNQEENPLFKTNVYKIEHIVALKERKYMEKFWNNVYTSTTATERKKINTESHTNITMPLRNHIRKQIYVFP